MTEQQREQMIKDMAKVIALSLYAYNVSPYHRAKKLYEHFNGNCMELQDMAEIFMNKNAYAMTELPYPTAKVYLSHALHKYYDEAMIRVLGNE